MFEIRKEFHFSAAHQLTHLPESHPCSRLHGHNYVVEVVLQSERLDANGFVVDYGDLAPLKRFIDNHFDHRNLNEVVAFPTTAENLARFLYDWCKVHWPQTVEVRVSETPKTWASYREDPRPFTVLQVPGLPDPDRAGPTIRPYVTGG